MPTSLWFEALALDRLATSATSPMDRVMARRHYWAIVSGCQRQGVASTHEKG